MRAALAGVALLIATPAAAEPYKANCQVCHRADGAGAPGQFPRLAGRIGVITARPEGRAYLIELLLSGMAGKIVVDGRPVIGVMPAFARLPDADIAAALSQAASFGGGKPKAFTAAEVKAVRARPRPGSTAVKAMRAALTTGGMLS